MKMTDGDIGYIAGLFDGEGCVTCKKKLTKRKDRKNKVNNDGVNIIAFICSKNLRNFYKRKHM